MFDYQTVLCFWRNHVEKTIVCVCGGVWGGIAPWKTRWPGLLSICPAGSGRISSKASCNRGVLGFTCQRGYSMAQYEVPESIHALAKGNFISQRDISKFDT